MKRLLGVFAFVLFATITANARVERIEVLSRADVLEGKAFDEAGA